MPKSKKIVFLYFLTLFLIITQLQAIPKHKIVVLIHGTISPFTSFKNFFKKTKKKPFNFSTKKLSCFYQNHLDQSRFNALHKYQPIGELGLQKIENGTANWQMNEYFAELLRSSYASCSPDKEMQFSFYTFGWDGRISDRKRRKWGKILYLSLTNEIERLKKTLPPETKICVEIYGHSHGPNITLNMAYYENKYRYNLCVCKLVILGTPIQRSTAHFATHKMFKKVFHVYSLNDIPQILDQGLSGSGLSYRRFESAGPDLKRHPNIIQIKVVSGKYRPTHWELWFFDINNSNMLYRFFYNKFLYRKSFPLYPFPIFIFMPRVIKKAKNICPQETDLHVNISKKNNVLNHLDFQITVAKKGI